MSSTPDERKPATPMRRGRSLRVRVGLVVGGALIALFLIFTVISALMTGYFFAGLQDHFTENKIEQVALAVDQLGQAKSRFVRDNAEWDETYDFIEGGEDGYLARNYGPGVNSSGQDVILVFDAQKKLKGAVQTQNEDHHYEVPAGLDHTVLAGSSLLSGDIAAGVALARDGLLLLAACPVRRSDLTGASNGWLVYGTYFTPERIADLGRTVGAEIRMLPATKVESPAEVRRVVVDLKALGAVTGYYQPIRVWQAGEPYSHMHMRMPSLTGKPDALVEIGLDLLVYRHALAERNWFLIVSAIFGLVFVGMALVAVEWSVLKPLAALDREMEGMTQGRGEVGLLKTGRDDEIGRLAKSANRLLERVLAGQQEARRQEELLSGVLDSTPEAVLAMQCVRDASGEITDLRMVVLNHSGEKMLRVEEGELTGKTIRETYPKLVEAGVYDRWKQAAVTRQVVSFETHYEGHKIAGWYRNSVAPWGDGVVVTVTDISERKIREQELAETLVELERFNAAMIGREERILEMKREVNALRRQLGLPETYEVNSHEA